MLIAIAILLMICGILLILKGKKTAEKQGLRAMIIAGGILLMILGMVLVYNLISGNIELPLH